MESTAGIRENRVARSEGHSLAVKLGNSMNIKSVYIAFFAVATLSSCVTTNTNYRPRALEISEPPIGQVVTAEVGNAMLRQGLYVEHDAIRLLSDVSVGMFGAYGFSPGFYLMEGQDEANEFYYPEPSSEGGEVRVGAMADPFKTMMVVKETGAVCGVTVLNAKSCADNARFERLKRPALTTNSFQQTLIYSGRVGDKINIAYREFSNNTARPAFNNDVEYDLGESTTIGYKGAEIEVIEATNRYIKYRVIENFNDATN